MYKTVLPFEEKDIGFMRIYDLSFFLPFIKSKPTGSWILRRAY